MVRKEIIDFFNAVQLDRQIMLTGKKQATIIKINYQHKQVKIISVVSKFNQTD